MIPKNMSYLHPQDWLVWTYLEQKVFANMVEWEYWEKIVLDRPQWALYLMRAALTTEEREHVYTEWRAPVKLGGSDGHSHQGYWLLSESGEGKDRLIPGASEGIELCSLGLWGNMVFGSNLFSLG